LTKVNENTEINFLDALQVRYEEFALAKGKELLKDLPKCKTWCDAEKLKSELNKIKLRKDAFTAECEDYMDFIRTFHDEYLLNFDDVMTQFENDNEELGLKIVDEEELERLWEELTREETIRRISELSPNERKLIENLFGLLNISQLVEPFIDWTQGKVSFEEVTYLTWIKTRKTLVNGQQTIETSEKQPQTFKENYKRVN